MVMLATSVTLSPRERLFLYHIQQNYDSRSIVEFVLANMLTKKSIYIFYYTTNMYLKQLSDFRVGLDTRNTAEDPENCLMPSAYVCY